jgi:DDE superfamily endonuclease
MTRRRVCPSAPGPLEAYAAQFDPLFGRLAQRRRFREYLQGLLLPRDRNKTLTALAGAEPIVEAQAAPVQGLQFFLSESTWDAEAVNTRRLEVLLTDPATAPHENGVLVIDDTGDRKAGTHTAHVAPQYLGSRGKVENGIVAVSSLWADERVYYPLHVRPYTPAQHFAKGQRDPAFRTKPQIAVELVDAALTLGVPFRAVVADCAYGDSEAFLEALGRAELPFVLALKPSRGTYAPIDQPHTALEAAEELRWGGADDPGDWIPIARHFRDGHTEAWWAAEVSLHPATPDPIDRLVVATTDPATFPPRSTWVLLTNLPRPGSPRAAEGALAPAELAEVVRVYGLRTWVEQGYKQLKHELGWADFMVRSDRAIRRHWQLVCCAFAFCWRAWFTAERGHSPPEVGPPPTPATPARAPTGRGKKEPAHGSPQPPRRRPTPVLAGGAASGPRLAESVDFPRALLAGVVRSAPASRAAGPPGPGRRWPSAAPLPPQPSS